MKLHKCFFGVIAFFGFSSAQALDSHGYLSLTEDKENGVASAEIILSYYHRAIYESVQAIAVANGLRLDLGDANPVFLPSSAALSSTSIEKAIEHQIGTHANPKDIGTLASAPVGSLAVFGLSDIFPCD